MDIKITLVRNVTDTPPPPPPAPGVYRRLKLWAADAQMTADNYSVTTRTLNGQIIGQFSLIQTYKLNADGNWIKEWSENQTAEPISTSELFKIAQLQLTNDGHSLDKKMNWLMDGGSDTWGSPMRASYPSTSRWREAVNIKQIAAIYAGQVVEILERRTFYGVNFNGRIEAAVPMSRIRTFTAADWGATHTTHPHIVHEVTCVDKGDRPIIPICGRVYLPLIMRQASAWVMDRWLA